MSTTYTADDLPWLTPLCQDIFILPEAERDEHLGAAGLDPQLIVALRKRVAELNAAKTKDKDALEDKDNDEDEDSHESTTTDAPWQASSSSTTAAAAPLAPSYFRSPAFERSFVRRRTPNIALAQRLPPHHRRPLSPAADPELNPRAPPLLTFRPDWPRTGDVYDIADYLSGDPLPQRSTWNVPAAIEHVHDAHAALSTRTYSVPTTARGFGKTLACDFRRWRLPVIHPLSGCGVPHDPKAKRKVLNAVETLSWMYGREMGAGHLRAVQLGSTPFADYVGERAKGVACANIMEALGRRGAGGGTDAGAGAAGSSRGGGGSGDSGLGGGSIKTSLNSSGSAKVGTRTARQLHEDGGSGSGSGHSGGTRGGGGSGGSGGGVGDRRRDDGHKSTSRDDDRGDGPSKRPRMSE